MTRITFNQRILGGKPLIRGTRISVDFILELFAAGMTESHILKEYPRLKRADIRAALEYAARTVKKEEILIR